MTHYKVPESFHKWGCVAQCLYLLRNPPRITSQSCQQCKPLYGHQLSIMIDRYLKKKRNKVEFILLRNAAGKVVATALKTL